MLPHARFDRLGVACRGSCHCYHCHCWRCSCSCLPACLNASMPQICLWRCRCCSQRSHRSSASQPGIAARHRWLASLLLLLLLLLLLALPLSTSTEVHVFFRWNNSIVCFSAVRRHHRGRHHQALSPCFCVLANPTVLPGLLPLLLLPTIRIRNVSQNGAQTLRNDAGAVIKMPLPEQPVCLL